MKKIKIKYKKKLKRKKIVKREDLVFKTNKYLYYFQQNKTIRPFSKNIFAGRTTLDKADRNQHDLLNDFIDFTERTKPRNIEEKS